MNWLIPAVSAHEVYVLPSDLVAHDVHTISPNPFSIIPQQLGQFWEWALIVGGILALVLVLSRSSVLQRICDPVLFKLKRYASFIARITLGISLFASGYYHALFGPELPFLNFFPSEISGGISLLFMILGICMMIGFLTRIVAAIAFLFFVCSVFIDHSYMATYANYLGEIILFIILGSGIWSLDNRLPWAKSLERPFAAFRRALEPYSFLILRILFGISLIYASLYAKFLHSDLALDTVHDYNLTHFFPFTPLFLVLGAFLIESLIGIAFIFGFAIRFFSIFFLCFLTLSILYFGEAVWPHAILFGVAIVMFLHGYDQYTVWGRGRAKEPVL